MDSTANTPASARRLPRAIDMMRAFSKPRQAQHIPTVISAPVGPVKSSRGVNLVRSDTFTIVTGIDDNTNEAVTPTPAQNKVKEFRRSSVTTGKTVSVLPIPKLSSGMKGVNSSITAKPTVASSTATATTTPMQTLSYNRKATSRRASLKPSVYVPLLDLKHTKHVSPPLISGEQAVQDENTPPTSDSAHGQQVAKQALVTRTSKLPKSRTMGVLQELKASISRPSTVLSRARQSSHVSIPTIKSSPSTDSTKTAMPHSASSSRLWLPHASLTSLVRSSRSATPEPIRPDQVVSAQPSAYWTGRFLALHDRFLSEALDERSSFNRPNGTSGSPKPRKSSLQDRTERPTQREHTMKNSTSQLPFSNNTGLPHANTTSSLSRIMFKTPANSALNEDDDRCRLIFIRLEESCLTAEAKQSLRDWQQAYARKENRPMLLPDGRVMDDKNCVVRFFSGNSGTKKRNTQQRQSLPGVPHLGKKGSKSDAILGAVRDKSLIVL